jgi:serine hydrolase
MKFFIIHGAYGNPNENWIPWLKENLEKKGHEVVVPKFPTPKNQTLDNWINIFNEYISDIDEDTIFIGHSLGVSFILSILEKINVITKASFLISGFLGLLGQQKFDEINKTFVNKNFDWNKIENNCSKFFVFHSDNDPYVDLKYGQDISKKLGEKLILVKGAGHFNKETGYTKFDLLLEKINEII